MSFNLSQFLGSFAGVVVLGAGVLGGTALSAADAPALATLNVARINIREPDGTLRMVISNADSAPGLIIRGREHPHPTRRSAGMLFFNEEGTENGGLIFDGRRNSDGVARSGGSLAFDRLEQDQVVQLVQNEEGAVRSAGLIVNDRPDAPMDLDAVDAARRTLKGDAQVAAFRKANVYGTQRAFVGRAEDGSAEIALRDGQGLRRIVMSVAVDGTSSIRFLDDNGETVRIMR